MKAVLVGYGSRGDVEPVAAVGRELRRRGHDVCMALPPNMIEFAGSAGIAGVAYGPDSREELNPAREVFQNLLPKRNNPLGMLSDAVEHVSKVKSEKCTTLKSLAEGADVLVAGFNEQELAGHIADYHDIPLVALHYFPERMWSGGLYTALMKPIDDALRTELGLPEANGPSPSLQIQAYDELCLPGPAAEWVEPGDRRPFVGALTLESPTNADEDVMSWIKAGTPPIYFGFGSSRLPAPAETLALISAACAQLGERALVCSGANDVAEVPRVDHVKVVDAVAHAAVFPACRAVVHHGGAGTTAAGMRAGIPTLILWFWLDQPMWAAGVTLLEVGAGRQFLATTLNSLVADLRSILTPHCVSRARELGSQLTDPAKSVATAADLVAEIARRDRDSQSVS